MGIYLNISSKPTIAWLRENGKPIDRVRFRNWPWQERGTDSFPVCAVFNQTGPKARQGFWACAVAFDKFEAERFTYREDTRRKELFAVSLDVIRQARALPPEDIKRLEKLL